MITKTDEQAKERVEYKRARRVELMEKGFTFEQACLIVRAEEVTQKQED